MIYNPSTFTVVTAEAATEQAESGRRDYFLGCDFLISNDREYRSFEVRGASEDKPVIEGYAVVFDSPTVMYTDERGTEYKEVVERSALASADMSDVVLTVDHGGTPLARTRNGSLELEVDSHGLKIRADMSGSNESRSTYEKIRNGLLDRMSFAFSIARDGDAYDQKNRTRCIRSIGKLFDVAVVTRPAYETTSVYARSFYEGKAADDAVEYRRMECKANRNAFAEIEQRYEHLIRRRGWEDSGTSWNPKADYERQEDAAVMEMVELRAQLDGVHDTDTEATGRTLAAMKEAEGKYLEAREKRKKILADVTEGIGCRTIEKFDRSETETRKDNNMSIENMEIRAFQKYVASGMSNMTPEETRSLVLSGTGAVLPVEIFNKMITDSKYSDLLSRATVINQGGAGTLKIPVASANAATWKDELAAVTPTAPTLTSIDLGGAELMRAIKYSAAVDHMAADQFVNWMAELVSTELVETLESAFVNGSTGDGMPHNGLVHLTWTPGTNAVETATTSTEIAAADVAKALSMLPQKYARNAVLLMNANTAYNTVGLFKGTSEYAYNMADGASRFMDKSIVVSEHIPADTIFIADAKELYVRFSMNPTVEIDRNSGFLSAANNMRCLTVVDYAWNPAACVRVTKKV